VGYRNKIKDMQYFGKNMLVGRTIVRQRMRRKFKGNKLYAAIFNAMAKGNIIYMSYMTTTITNSQLLSFIMLICLDLIKWKFLRKIRYGSFLFGP
jgi:hypothetical protein